MVARRYPGTKPSDLYGRKSADNPDGLDDRQAWELDSALAYRYESKDKDSFRRELHEIKQAIRLTGRFHGLKQIKYEKYKSALADLHMLDDDDKADNSKPVQDNLLVPLTKGSVIDNVTISRHNL